MPKLSNAQQELLKAPKTALFVINHSGGKDSQAMFRWMFDHLDHSRMVVIHSHLPGAEWEGTIEHIENTTLHIPLHIVQGIRSFFDMVRNRGMFPSAVTRECTSSLKRDPIAKFIRRYSKEHGYTTIYNCIGMRAEESSNRSKINPFTINKQLTTRSRTVLNVLPIHHYTVQDVFQSYNISLDELQDRRKLYKKGLHKIALKSWPFIWTYVAGMTRHSCKVCIMASKADLSCSARIDPQNFQEYINLETEVDHQFVNPNSSSPSLSQIFNSKDQETQTLEF